MKKKSGFLLFFTFTEILCLILGGVLISINYTLLSVSAILFLYAFIALLVVIITYNNIVRLKNKIDESFALIDIHLKLRFDLIPNLVSVVKKYSDHEKEIFTELVKLRNMATKANDTKEKVDLANKTVPLIKNMVAIAEGYPELKSSTLYKSLMDQLVDVEDRIVSSRRIYDSNVNAFNTAIETFPNNIIAKLVGFQRAELFRVDSSEKIVPNIDMRNV